MAGLVDRISALMDRAGALLGRYARPIRDALILVGLARAAYYFFVQDIQPWTFIGLDARAYWGIDLAHPYANSDLGGISNFLYSPAFAQAMAPFSLLPFPVFAGVWTLLGAALALWLARPWPWALVILCLPVTYEVFVGNIHLLLATAVVLSFRTQAIWAFPVLSKITPGVGVLWSLSRRDWRGVAIAVATTVGIACVSFVLNPSAWFEWVGFLLASTGGSQFLVPRTLIAAGLVVLGGLTGRRWLVAVAVWLALPVIYPNSWAVLLAVVRLREPIAPERPRSAAA